MKKHFVCGLCQRQFDNLEEVYNHICAGSHVIKKGVLNGK